MILNLRYKGLSILSMFLILATAYPSFAGPPLRSTDKIPHITSIESQGNFVWFAGVYYGALVLRFDRNKEKWDSFYYPLSPLWGRREVVQTSGSIQFFIYESLIRFDKASLRWSIEKLPRSEEFLPGGPLARYGIIDEENRITENSLRKRTFKREGSQYIFLNSFIYKIENGQVIKIFSLPQLTTSLLLKYCPELGDSFGYDKDRYELGDIINSIDNHIGHLQQSGDYVWFGLIFYDGEGWTGVGGIGFFDLKNEKIGILRLPPLRSCSISTITIDRDWLWAVTEHAGEYGPYGCSGLVKLNIKTGDYFIYPPPFQPLDEKDLLLYSIHKVDNEIWFATPYGITRYDEMQNTWIHYAVEKVKVKEGAEILTGIKPYHEKDKARFSYMSMGRLQTGEYLLLWVQDMEKTPPYFAIETPLKMVGWIKEKTHRYLPEGGRIGDEVAFIDLYSKPDETSKITGLLVVDRGIKPIEKDKGWVKVESRIGWVDGRHILPQIDIVKTGKDYQIGRFKGDGDIIGSMLKTAQAEYSERERDIYKATTILDKTCTIRPENLKCSGYIGGHSDIGLWINIWADDSDQVSRYTQIAGAKDGIFSVYLEVGGLSSAEGNRFNFAPYGRHILSDEGKSKSPQKEVVYKFENYRYRALIEVSDYKISPVILRDVSVYRSNSRFERVKERSGNIFEWVRFHIKVLKISEPSGQ